MAGAFGAAEAEWALHRGVLSAGVSQPSFYQWRRRLAAVPSAMDGARDRPLFVPVQVAEDRLASGGVVIDLPGGSPAPARPRRNQ